MPRRKETYNFDNYSVGDFQQVILGSKSKLPECPKCKLNGGVVTWKAGDGSYVCLNASHETHVFKPSEVAAARG